MFKILNQYIFFIFFQRFIFVLTLVMLALFAYRLAFFEGHHWGYFFVLRLTDYDRLSPVIMVLSCIWGLSILKRKKIPLLVLVNGLSPRRILFPIFLFMGLVLTISISFHYLLMPSLNRFVENQSSSFQISPLIIEGHQSFLFSSFYSCTDKKFGSFSLYVDMPLDQYLLVSSPSARYQDGLIMLENVDCFVISIHSFQKVRRFQVDGLVVRPDLFPLLSVRLQYVYRILSYFEYRQLIFLNKNDMSMKVISYNFWKKAFYLVDIFLICLFLCFLFILRQVNVRLKFLMIVTILMFLFASKYVLNYYFYSYQWVGVWVFICPRLFLMGLFLFSRYHFNNQFKTSLKA